MNSADARHDSVVLIPGAHRVIRILDKDEGPFAGALVSDRESVAVMTDADALGGWAGWAHAGDEHVAAPVDVVRRRDGHDVLLPWCTERVSVFLGRREAVGELLSAGEVSTLVGSLLRGLDELRRSPAGTEAGEWWLSDQGRPLFVIGAGDDARLSAAKLVDVLHRTAVDRMLARLLAGIRDGLRKDSERPGAPQRQLHLWEAELLAIASPRPLRRDSHAPERVRDIEMVRSLRAEPLESRRSVRAAARGDEMHGRSSVLHRFLVTVLVTLRGVGRAAVHRMRRLAPAARAVGNGHHDRVTEPRRADPEREGAVGAPSRSRRRFLVAGAAAAIILAGGLLWPEGATEGAPAADGSASAHDSTVATNADDPEGTGAAAPAPTARSGSREDDPAQSAPSGPPEHAAHEDPVQAASRLSSSMRDCAESGDEACLQALVPGSTAMHDLLSTGSLGVIDAQSEFTLVDEYGDVAVVRVTSAVEADEEALAVSERLLVLVRADDEWLVRDAYDVADQPS
nr:hypothetical protein [Microbacterium hydrocarbonoxydans]